MRVCRSLITPADEGVVDLPAQDLLAIGGGEFRAFVSVQVTPSHEAPSSNSGKPDLTPGIRCQQELLVLQTVAELYRAAERTATPSQQP